MTWVIFDVYVPADNLTATTNKSFRQQLMPPSTRRIHNAFLLFCCCYSREQVRGPYCYLLLKPLYIYHAGLVWNARGIFAL
jgi:hypothetical protein